MLKLALLIEMILPLILAFIVSITIGPVVISFLKRKKLGQTIQTDGPESHKPKAGTPTMGGIIIIIGLLSGLVLTTFISYKQYGSEIMGLNEPIMLNIIALLILILGYALIGLIDDHLTIKPIRGIRGIASKPKAGLQFLLAAGFVLWLRQTEFEPILWVMGETWFLGEAYWPLAALFIAGLANFINITDGLDGLVSGLTIIAIIAFFASVIYSVSSKLPDSKQFCILMYLLLSTVGACAAFLVYNRYPAKVFMGDTGSLALGALLPGVAILLHREILIIVVGLVFILDGLSSAVQWAVFKYTRIRTGAGRRVFLKSPVHHHFEMLGWPEQRVVIMFWLFGVAAAALGFGGAALGLW